MSNIAPQPDWMRLAACVPFVGGAVVAYATPHFLPQQGQVDALKKTDAVMRAYLLPNLMRSMLVISLLIAAIVMPTLSFLLIPLCIAQLSGSVIACGVHLYKHHRDLREIGVFSLLLGANGLKGACYALAPLVPVVTIAMEALYLIQAFTLYIFSKAPQRANPDLQKLLDTAERGEVTEFTAKHTAFIQEYRRAKKEDHYFHLAANKEVRDDATRLVKNLHQAREKKMKACYKQFRALKQKPTKAQKRHFDLIFPEFKGLLKSEAEEDFLGRERIQVHPLKKYLTNIVQDAAEVERLKRESKARLRNYLEPRVTHCASDAMKGLVQEYLAGSDRRREGLDSVISFFKRTETKAKKAEEVLLYFSEVRALLIPGRQATSELFEPIP